MKERETITKDDVGTVPPPKKTKAPVIVADEERCAKAVDVFVAALAGEGDSVAQVHRNTAHALGLLMVRIKGLRLAARKARLHAFVESLTETPAKD